MFSKCLPLVALLVVGSGCAVVNTFQTPTVLKPGTASFSPGLVLGGEGPEDEEATLGRGLQLHARMGILRYVELGVQVIGLAAAGADAKIGYQHGDFAVAGNVGLGVGGHGSSGLTGFESRTTRTRFGGVFAGYRGAYVGAKLIDYHDRRNVPDEEPLRIYDRTIPALVVGFAPVAPRKVLPMMEMNLYRFPDQTVYTFGMGMRIIVGE